MSVASAGRRPGTAVHPLRAARGNLSARAAGRPSAADGRTGATAAPRRLRLTLVPPIASPDPAPSSGRPGTVQGSRTRRKPPHGPGARPAVLGGPPARGAAARRRRGARRPIRLTRRGRVVVWAGATLILAAILVPVLLMMASGAQAANHGGPPGVVRAGLHSVKVRPGDSLWSIALRAEPEADPRLVSQQIIQFNALGGDVLVPGETLWVPGT